MNKSCFVRYGGLMMMCLGLVACGQGTWESLFNGENLDGWTVKCIPADEGHTYWRVHDGYIECNSKDYPEHNYVWLLSDRQFSDFHLKLKFQVFRGSDGNSGVQFRSSYDTSDSAGFGGWLNGPQVDIHGPAPFRTGLIYDETEGIRRWIHPSLPDWRIEPGQVPESALETSLVYAEDNPETWNTLELVCEGMDILTRVNGNPVTVFDADGILNDEIHRSRNSGERGSIGFQLHMNDELKIRFKDILIKEKSR